ncbi:retinitis pigmentosa 9 protein-like isoform X1 [Dinothrombium tinctorium]|uniref:Retinitis pigmentosa 9 protein-like isoform X1 n=1 Tax=Dinothrombium tinctorium TaxID=1965070 RepID=A0A3S3PSM1_9ACAR|nr:retinitis pigmentosa 9 protein-like isoform X1 [Dinothrombium tinctorium]
MSDAGSKEDETSDERNNLGLDPIRDKALIKALKHIDTFYEKPPPGYFKQPEERPEDTIPDLPENRAAREFLARAPTKGLWMPLGKEVKVMQCWRCKAFGHRTGDKECPMFLSGNKEIEKFRYMYEDPMVNYIVENRVKEKQEKVKQLQALLDETSSSSDSDEDPEYSSSTSSDRRWSSNDETDRKCRRRHSRKHHKRHRSRSRSSSSSRASNGSRERKRHKSKRKHRKHEKSKSKHKSKSHKTKRKHK